MIRRLVGGGSARTALPRPGTPAYRAHLEAEERRVGAQLGLLPSVGTQAPLLTVVEPEVPQALPAVPTVGAPSDPALRDAERRMADTFTAWCALEAARLATGSTAVSRAEVDAAWAYRHALDAYAALAPVVRDLTPDETHAQLRVLGVVLGHRPPAATVVAREVGS